VQIYRQLNDKKKLRKGNTMAKRDIPGGTASSGVEELINRLHDEGVARGKQEADKIIADAKNKAEQIVNEAERASQEIIHKTQEESRRFKEAGEEALKVAFRDTIIDLKSRIMHRFTNDVERLISTELKEEDFLRRLILEVAGSAAKDAGVDKQKHLEVILPRDVVGIEELRRKPEEIKEGTLSHFVMAMAHNLLREGITFKASDDMSSGVQIRLIDNNIDIQLTDKAIASLLLEHLQPRFRALLEGIVK
jgi:V/A-type H+-transporting ATPase subunit E